MRGASKIISKAIVVVNKHFYCAHIKKNARAFQLSAVIAKVKL